MLFTKYSIVKCPVCGQAGKNLKYVEEDEARVRKELDETIRHAKQLAEAINMSKEELVRMIQE